MVDLMGMVSVITALIVFAGLISGGWDTIKTWLSRETGNQLRIKDLDDDSDIRQYVSKRDAEKKRMHENIDKLMVAVEEQDWVDKDLKAYILSIKILLGIQLKMDCNDIIKEYEEYTNIPQKNGEKRDGYLTWVVRDYCGDLMNMEGKE